MILHSIQLTNFRNFEKVGYSFSPQLTLILGENARGKTNLLEAIYFVIYGRGFRELEEEELLMIKSSAGLVEAVFFEHEQKMLLQISLRLVSGRLEKKYFVNKTSKNYHFYNRLPKQAVLFSPEHILIVIGSPERRRDYLNRSIGNYDPEYLLKWRNYENALRQRNKILETQINHTYLEEELTFWNHYLEEQSQYITKKRQEYIDYFNNRPIIDSHSFYIDYSPNIFNQQRLAQTAADERRIRRTLIGPQKDDFVIYLVDQNEKKNIHLYGSRSQQRLAVFWLKLNEISFLEKTTKIKPLLLLDDIFSELDMNNKQMVLRLVKDYQTVATSVESHLPELTALPKVIIKL